MQKSSPFKNKIFAFSIACYAISRINTYAHADSLLSDKKVIEENYSGTVGGSANALDALLCNNKKHCTSTPLDAGVDTTGRRLFVLSSEQNGGMSEIVWLFAKSSSTWNSVQALAKIPTEEPPEIEVGTNTVTINITNEGMIHHRRSATFQTFPPRLLKITNIYDGAAQYPTSQTWDFLDFHGEGFNSFQSSPTWDWVQWHYQLIPQISSDTFSWRDIVLGGCSLTVDSKNGYLMAGSRSVTTDPYFRILAISDKDLVLNIPSRAWKLGAKNWLNDDHLEVWVRDEDDDTQLWQWGIRLADGKVFRAYGHPPYSPGVALADLSVHGESYRAVRVSLHRYEAIAVLLSLSDGKSVKLLISTAQMKFGDEGTLGYQDSIDSDHWAQCREEDGRLMVGSEKSHASGEPLIIWQ